MRSLGNVLVTGGAGFIGSAMVRYLIQHTDSKVLNVDKLTYAGNRESLKEIADSPRYRFLQADICDIGAMGQAFERMRAALEGRKYIEQYVQTLTHEIKSPLSAIRGAAELLGEQMEPQQRDRFLKNIINEAARIQDLVDRMLELSALESRTVLQAAENVSLQALIRTVLESRQPLLSKKHLKTVTHFEEDVLIRGDSFLLHQAIGNLVQNAIDFSPDHGRLSLAVATAGDLATLTVEDDGPGIPDFAREKVFEKFFSLQRPGTGKKSTGLGLNLVMEVAKLHGGDVSLENRPGQGARAVLTIGLTNP